jgi:hypothetical protein
VLTCGKTVSEPDKFLVPDQPFEAKQLLAFEELQVRSELPPKLIIEGLLEIVTKGSCCVLGVG